MYVQNGAAFRGNIFNDVSGQPVTIADTLQVTGAATFSSTISSGAITSTELTITGGSDSADLYIK